MSAATAARIVVRKAIPRNSGTSIPWITYMHNMDRTKSLTIAISAFAIASSYDFVWKFIFNHNESAPKTHNPAWAEATRAYLRWQNCNPIFGISSKK
mmetsp:Transcript_39734/g.77653  ORF Transcript_39734/g.77653 Transcript_39734/m.77653 type:complete len:97 (-) Transcript_39734:306-596(-)